MNRLSKEKKQQLLLAIIVALLSVAGIWFFLIRSQLDGLQKLALKREGAKQKLHQVRQAIEHADEIESDLCEAKKRLDKVEEEMASGDLYSWAITTIRTFKLPYKIDIPQYSQVDGPKNVTMLAAFPYKQATLTISGTGMFHDFGRFVADFENQFPHARLVNLSLEPVAGTLATEPERLAFKMDIIVLIKPGTT